MQKFIERIQASVNDLLKGEGLRAKITRGGIWLGGGSAAEQVSRFARNIILARLLMPSAFGAMAIVTSFSSLINSLSDVGLWPAVVQNPRGGRDEYLNAAWWIGLIRAFSIYAAIFPVAPWIAHFYGDPELSGLLRVTLLGFVFDGFTSPRAKLTQKEMKFRRLALFNNGGALCGVILTVVLSVILRNVWALAIGYCAENIFRCAFSYIVCPGLPSLRIDKQASKEILQFSQGMFGLSFFNLIFSRADVFIIGKMFSATDLGLYTLAVNLVQTPASFLIGILNQMLLPAFAHVQADANKIRYILFEATTWCVLFGLPIVGAIWLCSPALLTVVYGERYSVVATALTVAAVVSLINTLNSLITNQFFASGRPELHRRAVAASALIMLIAVYPFCKFFGVAGGQCAALIAIVISFVLQMERAYTMKQIEFPRYIKPFVWALVPFVCVIVIGMSASTIGVVHTPATKIAIAGTSCFVVCALLLSFCSSRKLLRI